MTFVTGNKLFYFGLAFTALFLFSCSGNQKIEEPAAVETTTTPAEKVNKVFYAIPSPIEMAGLLRKAGANYDIKYLNSNENLSKYTTSQSKAINLGIYGTDMSFASIFDQAQETMLYLKCVNKLSSGIGISAAFDDKTAERMEANSGNRDSILQIISDAYWVADSYLKDEGRESISALIISGGWVEGLYIATKVAGITHNKEIITRIGEQKLSLNNLVSLLESYPADETLTSMITELKSLQEIFNEIKVNSAKASVKTDPENKISTITGDTKVEITEDHLNRITSKIESIRNNLIK